MNVRLFHTLLALLISASLAGHAATAQTTKSADGAATQPAEAQEPPLEFSLTVDGRSIDLAEGKPFELSIGGTKASATLAVKPDKAFSAGGVSFRYPREFAFEADLTTPGVTSWTLDGNNAVIMLFRYGVGIAPLEAHKLYVSGASEQFGRRSTKVQKTSLELAGQTLQGQRMLVSLAGTKLRQDVYAFKAGGSTCVMVLQDSLNEEGDPTAEFERTVELLQKTFVIND